MARVGRILLSCLALAIAGVTSAHAQVTPVYQGIRFGSFDSGAAGTPSITFTFDRRTGLWLVGTSDLGVSVAGVKVADWTASKLTLASGYGLRAGANDLIAFDLIDFTKGTRQVPTINGGTGIGTYAQGDLLYASATNVLSRLPKNTGLMMTLCNAGPWNAPAWCKLASTNLSNAANIALLDGTQTFTGANTFSSTSTFTGKAVLKQYTETKTAPTISANTLTIDMSAGTYFAVPLTAQINTFTLSNCPSTGVAGSVVIAFTNDGTTRTITWGSAVKWSNGTAPTMSGTNNKVDIFTFFTYDACATVYAFNSGQNF